MSYPNLIKLFVVIILSLKLNVIYASTLSPEQLQAAYVQKFTQYIEWKETNSPEFRIAVLNNNELYQALIESFSNKELNKKKVIVLDIKQISSKDIYDILLINEINGPLTPVIKATQRSDMLIITRDENGLNEYSIINFFIDNGKLRFDINGIALKSSNLKINSRLLNLARNLK